MHKNQHHLWQQIPASAWSPQQLCGTFPTEWKRSVQNVLIHLLILLHFILIVLTAPQIHNIQLSNFLSFPQGKPVATPASYLNWSWERSEQSEVCSARHGFAALSTGCLWVLLPASYGDNSLWKTLPLLRGQIGYVQTNIPGDGRPWLLEGAPLQVRMLCSALTCTGQPRASPEYLPAGKIKSRQSLNTSLIAGSRMNAT